eukprot:s583_g9.t1
MAKVLSEDPWYCRWLLQAAKAGNASFNMEEMAAWLEENAEHLEDDDIRASGPNHHGRPLSELVVHDPSYCSWILRTAQERLANIFAAEAGLAVTVDSWMIVLQRCDLSAACLFDGAMDTCR